MAKPTKRPVPTAESLDTLDIHPGGCLKIDHNAVTTRPYNGFSCPSCPDLFVEVCTAQLKWFANNIKTPELSVANIPDDLSRRRAYPRPRAKTLILQKEREFVAKLLVPFHSYPIISLNPDVLNQSNGGSTATATEKLTEPTYAQSIFMAKEQISRLIPRKIFRKNVSSCLL